MNLNDVFKMISSKCSEAMMLDHARLDQDRYWLEHLLPTLHLPPPKCEPPKEIRSNLIWWDETRVITMSGLKPNILTRQYDLPKKFVVSSTHLMKCLSLSERDLHIATKQHKVFIEDAYFALVLRTETYELMSNGWTYPSRFTPNEAMLAYEG